MNDVTLSSGMRSSLLALTRTGERIDRTRTSLATGREVSEAVDGPVRYFQSKSLTDRAVLLEQRKSGVDQAVHALETSLQAYDTMTDLLSQMKGVLTVSRNSDQTQREAQYEQLKELSIQIQKVVEDASYQGLNLLSSSSSELTVRFSEKSESTLEVEGVDFNTSALFLDSTGVPEDGGGFVYMQKQYSGTWVDDYLELADGAEGGSHVYMYDYDFDDPDELALYNERADVGLARLDKTISNVEAQAAEVATNISILQVRSDFTATYADTLIQGAEQLTVADLNEEGAQLLSLQTRQQLALQSLSVAGRSEQTVSQLFG